MEPQEGSRLNVELIEDYWVVKNNGDSSVLFKSKDKEAAEKFAHQMSDAHEIDVKIYSEQENSDSPTKPPVPLKVNVEKREGRWVVRIEGDSREQFSSEEKESALEFVKTLEQENGIDLHVDKD